MIDCAGCVVIPGFVDTHRHTWETAIRSCAPNATLDDYFVEVLDSFAPLYDPRRSTQATWQPWVHQRRHPTLVDWSTSTTRGPPGRPDPRALEAGIERSAYGSANTSLAEYWFDSSIAIPRDDVGQIEHVLPSDLECCTMEPTHGG